MHREVIECNAEVAMEIKRCSDFVQYIISKKSSDLARAFLDLWSLVMFWKVLKLHSTTGCTILRTFKTSGAWTICEPCEFRI